MKRLSVICLLGSILIASAACRAGDWPCYRGPDQDGTVTDLKLPAEWPKELTTKWKVDLGEGYGSPAVAGGRVFVLAQQDRTNEVIHCLDAATGERKWKHAYPARYKTGLARTGPRNTPTVDGDRVYTIGATGWMHCLKTADGQVLWQKRLRGRPPTYGFSTSPLIDGERVIVHTGVRGSSVMALNKLTGEVIWRSQSDRIGYASPMIVSASPTRGPRQLIVFTEAGVVSLNPDDGAFYWRFPWTTSYEQNIAQPMLDGDRLYVTSLTGFAALALEKRAGKPAFRQAYRNNAMIGFFSCPVTRNGFLYGAHGRRVAIRCVELKDGKVKWSHDLSGGQRAGVVRVGGQLLIYTENGKLVVVDADPARYNKRAEYTLAGFNWSPPIVAGGCLYLRDARSLRCVLLPKEGRDE